MEENTDCEGRMMDRRDYLKASFLKSNIALTDRQTDQFLTYYDMLIEKNQVMNLTAITEFEDVVLKHFVDSVSLLSHSATDYTGSSIADLGTGAGFPGIPLKIVLGDDVNITLMDSLNKRILFLEEVIQALDLKNIRAVHTRAEDAGRNPQYREQFDYCVSRAVANLSTLCEYDLPLIKVGGKLIAYKATSAMEELEVAKSAIYLLGGSVNPESGIINFTLPESDISRTILVVDKVRPTGKKYPRKAGMPSKEPL